jgi:hypothetical protein
MLVLVMAIGLLVNWGLAGALLFLFMVQIARPLDFMAAALGCVAGAASVFNEGGGMTIQLSRLSVGVAVMVLCYLLRMRGRSISVPRTSLTVPLLVFLALSTVNALRGLQGGAPGKNVGLELYPLLGLGGAFLIGNVFDPRRDLKFAIAMLVLVGYGVAIWGLYVFSITHAHEIGFYSMAIPGFVGLLLVNLALRAEDTWRALGFIGLSVLLFVHQFVTFGRGLWTGCIAGLIVSSLMFAGWGKGTSPRWRRVGLVMTVLLGVALAGALGAAVAFNRADLLKQGAARFNTIGTVNGKMETRSNVIRLLESARVITLIIQSPIVGHGVGFTFTFKDPFNRKLASQWGVHENFLLVFLKQGIIGLACFLWMLWAAASFTWRETRRRTDPLEGTWFATAATCTVFMIVFSLSNYPFARVNETFFLAMVWGGAMAMGRTGLVTLRWNEPELATPPRLAPGAVLAPGTALAAERPEC